MSNDYYGVRRGIVFPLLLILVITAMTIVQRGINERHQTVLETIQAQPKVVQTPPKQPVYLMVRCPKGGGDAVFNITDDIALRQVYPN